MTMVLCKCFDIYTIIYIINPLCTMMHFCAGMTHSAVQRIKQRACAMRWKRTFVKNLEERLHSSICGRLTPSAAAERVQLAYMLSGLDSDTVLDLVAFLAWLLSRKLSGIPARVSS